MRASRLPVVFRQKDYFYTYGFPHYDNGALKYRREMPFFPIKHEQPIMDKQVRIYFLFLQIDILL